MSNYKEGSVNLLRKMPIRNLRNLIRYIASGKKLISGSFTDFKGKGCLLGVAFNVQNYKHGQDVNDARKSATEAFGYYPVTLAEFNNDCIMHNNEEELYGTIVKVALDRRVKA